MFCVYTDIMAQDDIVTFEKNASFSGQRICYKKALHKAEWQLSSWLEENAFCETNYCID